MRFAPPEVEFGKFRKLTPPFRGSFGLKDIQSRSME
jgi:hypothetical protein